MRQAVLTFQIKIRSIAAMNPLAMIMSFAMMLKYSFDMLEDSKLIEKAIQNVLSKGLRTPDIKQGNEKAISTKEMGAAVIEELNIISGS